MAAELWVAPRAGATSHFPARRPPMFDFSEGATASASFLLSTNLSSIRHSRDNPSPPRLSAVDAIPYLRRWTFSDWSAPSSLILVVSLDCPFSFGVSERSCRAVLSRPPNQTTSGQRNHCRSLPATHQVPPNNTHHQLLSMTRRPRASF